MSRVFKKKGAKTAARSETFVVDIWVYLMVTSALVLAFFIDAVYADVDPVLTAKTKSQILWILAGMALSMTFGVASGGKWMPLPSFDVDIDETEGNRVVVAVLAGVVVLSVTSYIVLQTAATLGLSALTPTDDAQRAITNGFLTVSAVGEELFFRFALYGGLSVFLANTRWGKVNKSFAATATSAIFAAYHLGVYGNDPDLLWVVFVNSLLLCVIYDVTRRLSVVMTIHMWNNFLASGAIQMLLGVGL